MCHLTSSIACLQEDDYSEDALAKVMGLLVAGPLALDNDTKRPLGLILHLCDCRHRVIRRLHSDSTVSRLPAPAGVAIPHGRVLDACQGVPCHARALFGHDAIPPKVGSCLAPLAALLRRLPCSVGYGCLAESSVANVNSGWCIPHLFLASRLLADRPSVVTRVNESVLEDVPYLSNEEHVFAEVDANEVRL